jgi:hypothetical protein
VTDPSAALASMLRMWIDWKGSNPLAKEKGALTNHCNGSRDVNCYRKAFLSVVAINNQDQVQRMSGRNNRKSRPDKSFPLKPECESLQEKVEQGEQSSLRK